MVGGLVVLLILGAAVLFIIRRRRRVEEVPDVDEEVPDVPGNQTELETLSARPGQQNGSVGPVEVGDREVEPSLVGQAGLAEVGREVDKAPVEVESHEIEHASLE